jgi:hypothetical protein
MGDGVNIAARLEGIAATGAICLSEDAYRQVRDKIKETFVDLGEKELKNIARPVRVYSVKASAAGSALATHSSGRESWGRLVSLSWCCPSRISAARASYPRSPSSRSSSFTSSDW